MEDRYAKIKRRLNNIYHDINMSDKDIIELLSKEIDYYRNKIDNLEKVRQEQNKYIAEHMTIDEIIKDIIAKEYRIKYQSIEGSVKDIKFVSRGIQDIYKLVLLTDCMYEITIEPIAAGTIRDIHKNISKGEAYYSI